MEVIIFNSEAYLKLQAEMAALIKRSIEEAGLVNINSETPSGEWLTLADAKKLLPYKSLTKWQELRDRGDLVFSQFGRKILYSRTSLLDYIGKNKIACK